MKAPPLYQDFFDTLALQVRKIEHGAKVEEAPLRGLIKRELTKVERRSAADPVLRQVFGLVRLPLIFVADNLIVESGAPFSKKWNDDRLAYEDNELAGDEKFFDLLEQYLDTSGETASEALAVMYHAMGLGFRGWYTSQPEKITEFMEAIAQRLPQEFSQRSEITPEAYQGLDTRNLIVNPKSRLGAMISIFAVLILSVLVVAFAAFRFATSDMRESLFEITTKERFLYPDAALPDHDH